MARFKQVDGIKVQLTTQEEVDFDTATQAGIAAKPLQVWHDDMANTDSSMPRYMEDLITSNASFVIPTEMKKRYDAKIKIRGEKP